MAAPQGILRAHQGQQKILFRVEGLAQMDLGLALRKAAEHGLAAGATTLLVDLRQCAYMDSTFLGTLLFLQRAMQRRQGEFALISPSTQCCELLEQMSLSDVFPVRTEETLSAVCWTSLTADVDDTEAFKRNVVQAHVELACLPGAAGEPFKKVARMLTEEMQAKNDK